jgi:hypothetical protein
MKLQGIILLASVAVSTPIIVPLGALGGTVKLLIVIVMNLSGGAISLLNEVRRRFLEHGNGRPLRCCEL